MHSVPHARRYAADHGLADAWLPEKVAIQEAPKSGGRHNLPDRFWGYTTETRHHRGRSASPQNGHYLRKLEDDGLGSVEAAQDGPPEGRAVGEQSLRNRLGGGLRSLASGCEVLGQSMHQQRLAAA